MMYAKDNTFVESNSPHSIGLQNNLTIPNPGWDANPLLQIEKSYWGANNSKGIGGLTFDGTGILGTGLFASSDVQTWGIGEWGAIGLLIYLVGSIKGDTTRAYTKASVSYKSRQAKIERRRKLQKQLEEA